MGGEFEISINELKSFDEWERPEMNNLIHFSNGRSALFQILQDIRIKRKNKFFSVHMPYYLCESVFNTCFSCNVEMHFYENTPLLTFPLDYLNRLLENDVVLIVNYFGFLTDENSRIISQIKSNRPDVIIVEDNVQAYWTYKISKAHYSFTSLRKHFPVPDGAFVSLNGVTDFYCNSLPQNEFYPKKLLASLLKSRRMSETLYMSLFNEGEITLDNSIGAFSGSEIGLFLYEKINKVSMYKKRLSNAQCVYEIGKNYGIEFLFEYKPGIVPLNIPIIIRHGRDIVRKYMMSNKVFLPVHWPLSKYNQSSVSALQNANTELSLLVDHRYSKIEIERQMDLLIKGIKAYA